MRFESKYDKGQQVYWASTSTKECRHECPDCFGRRKWEVISPAGQFYTFSCPRCCYSYGTRHRFSLSYNVVVPTVRLLTISEVSFDRHDSGFRYMCSETSQNGCGAVYRECDLYLTQAEALAAGQLKANAEWDDPDKYYKGLFDHTLMLSEYQLTDARAKMLELADQAVRDLGWKLKYAIEEHIDGVNSYPITLEELRETTKESCDKLNDLLEDA